MKGDYISVLQSIQEGFQITVHAFGVTWQKPRNIRCPPIKDSLKKQAAK